MTSLAFKMLPWMLILLALLPSWCHGQQQQQHQGRPGEFVAGSFVLTQTSLSEAPYRYAGVLRKALDKLETKDPPSQSQEKNCDVRYRIRPSGEL